MEQLGAWAIGTVRGHQSVDAIRDFLLAKGLSNIKVASLGAKEMVLSFDNRGEMLKALENARLRTKFETISPASQSSVPTRHFL